MSRTVLGLTPNICAPSTIVSGSLSRIGTPVVLETWKTTVTVASGGSAASNRTASSRVSSRVVVRSVPGRCLTRFGRDTFRLTELIVERDRH